MPPRTVGKYVLPRDQARDGARRQVRVSPVRPVAAAGGRVDTLIWILLAIVAALVGTRLL